MLDAVQIVVALFAMMSVGYVLAAKGWIDEQVAVFVSKGIVHLGVPAAALDNMLHNFDRAMLGEALLAALVAFGAILLCLLLGRGIAALFHVQQGRKGIFTVMVGCANTIFIGLPVCQALFGEAAASYVLIYDMAHSLIFWTLGVYLMSRDGSEKQPFFSGKTLKKLLSPGLLGLLAAILLVLLEVKLPIFAEKTFKYFGGLCTPLALIYVGYVLYRTGWKNMRLNKDMLLAILGRVVLAPLVFYLVTRLVRLPTELSMVFVTIAAMPVMNNTPIVAGEYGSDEAFGSQCLALTMILSLLTMPLLMLIFNGLY